ncbi:uncharacterized protein LOC105223899 isoform X1 [Bactrocera dorsalis]|uniref:Uncharacterized protein LOC105223899 isoform X1 n=2 Tax=Bactrocera dorsalis TaxID=27457 RepID=A0ABM3K9Y7_BACDO|nr:uncharacterized protein LOC105223899 isoform X1 [Bactrocera dorsalis]
MQGRGGVAEIRNSVHFFKRNSAQSKSSNVKLQPETLYSSKEIQQCASLFREKKSQDSINICVISGDGDINHIKISDSESEFAGFGSLTNSSESSLGKQRKFEKSFSKMSVKKRTMESKRLNMKECDFQQKEHSSLKSIYDIESMELDFEGNPVPDKHKIIMNAKEVDDHVQNPVNEIVEICSKSTTSSEAYKRQKINSNLQLHLRLNQTTVNSNSNKNKCSTETTSDFPVSSPSNPRKRTALQKNTLSGDVFERNLALLTTQKPQMSLDEKINAWKCDIDFSEVEDVDSFDDLFREHEELQKRVIQDKKNRNSAFNSTQYDFNVFRNDILPRITTTTTLIEKDEKTKPSATGTFSAQRRMRAALEFECKKRQQQHLLRGRNTTPTFTSSSENDLLLCLTSKQKFNSNQQKLRPRSSEQGNQVLNGKSSCDILKSKEATCRRSQMAIGGYPSLVSRRFRPSADEESVFKLRRLNREIDKFNEKNETNSRGLIQMRLDFAIQNKSQQLYERRSQLFKTPTLPQKHMPLPVPTQLPTPNSTALNVSILMSKNTHSFNPNMDKNTECPLHQSEDNELQTEIISTSPHEAAQSYSTLSPVSKNLISTSACHQQQEFCNYLGLTGMSTANAVANAVAELAKCNLTRRSLRVRRLKQQEKSENNQKITNSKDIVLDDKYVETTMGERFSAAEIIEKKETTETSANLRIKEPQPPPNLKCSCTLAEGNGKNIKEQEEIICNVSCKTPKECIEEDTMHNTLLRHLKNNTTNSNGTSTCPRSSVSDIIYDYEINSNPTPNDSQRNNNVLDTEYRPSPTQNSACSSYKNTFTSNSIEHQNSIKRQLHNKFKKYLEASRKMKPSIYIVDTLHNPDPRQGFQHENNRMVDVETFSAGEKIANNELSNETDVECIEKNVKNAKINNIESLDAQKQEMPLLSKQKKKDRLRKLLTVATPWHKIKNHRQLRNRKILLVKRIKTAPNKIQKSAKPSASIVKSEHCSIISTSKSNLSKTKGTTSEKVKNQGYKKKYKRVHKGKLTNKSTQSPPDTSTESPELYCISSPIQKVQTTSTGRRRLRSKSFPMLSSVNLANSRKDNTKINPPVCNLDNDTVVVSSTTNSYDEATLLKLNKIDSPSQISHELKSDQNDTSCVIRTKDSSTQSVFPLGIHFLSAPSHQLNNPVKTVNGAIDYIYYEMDVLIIVQERTVSFWKSFKLINVLTKSQNCEKYSHRINNEDMYRPPYSSVMDDTSPQWLPLGECRRLSADMEILTSYANRICIHNSIPIYVEMRCREIPHERRDCNLLSLYINIYYFNDEDMVAKIHSIQLDAVQGLPADVVYTTITDSRYFIMSWPQQNILGKPRSGLCKYSLTPNLDTLASIRDFKHIKHCVRYLECTTDDKLLGFGDTQLTIWDHRSGDVLMNYDFNMKLGRNLGSIYYPSLEIGQNSVLLLCQYKTKISENEYEPTEIIFIACSVSHTNPSHRVLRHLKTPSKAFDALENAINTGDYIVITAKNDEEIWINNSDATTITKVPPQYTRRFYARGRSQIIELTCKSLTVDSFSNHVLKLAANPAVNETKSNKEE